MCGGAERSAEKGTGPRKGKLAQAVLRYCPAQVARRQGTRSRKDRGGKLAQGKNCSREYSTSSTQLLLIGCLGWDSEEWAEPYPYPLPWGSGVTGDALAHYERQRHETH